ncbi:NAD(P)H-quinone oxidoreductase subunit S, chloroplastic [Cornus florida]|uniref:NAD(P)H-quinone oxidoreductase subunit S, chloroplastic n=1 Tax=Cornus florida TaxID=4283 RepID=UPI0028970400|nr:NAD(P)H-quinone oxidoreductase subunit S, chloroplastic [Cornus florida]
MNKTLSLSLSLSLSLQDSLLQSMASSSFTLPSLQGPLLHKSHFLGQTHLFNLPQKPNLIFPKVPLTFLLKPTAKFKLSEILGGRGLCNGEEGLQQELKRSITEQPPSTLAIKDQEKKLATSSSTVETILEDGFDKELLGLTGGFPGGEKGLQNFIEKNPPPKKTAVNDGLATAGFNQSLMKKPKPPELPLLMPGMIALVKNTNSPYYMYCGIVQRITDGKAGVLFEGGNWDRLITFRLEELERREKGPPMVSPRSVVLEALTEKDS